MSAILVTGGIGTLGRPLVRLLTGRGAAVRVLSRRPRPAPAPPYEWYTGDLRRGRGIEAAVAGADTIIHCATGRGDAGAARTLLAAARRAGRPAPGLHLDRRDRPDRRGLLPQQTGDGAADRGLRAAVDGTARHPVPRSDRARLRGAGPPSGVAGPGRHLTGSYLRTNGRHRRVQPVWLPGRAAAALRRGDNLAPGRACGRVTFEEFLGGHR